MGKGMVWVNKQFNFVEDDRKFFRELADAIKLQVDGNRVVDMPEGTATIELSVTLAREIEARIRKSLLL